MTSRNHVQQAMLIIVTLFALLLLFAALPAAVQAAPATPFQSIPGWLEEALEGLLRAIQIELVKTLQDTARVGGVLLWGVLKVCGMVGLFAEDFSTLFGAVVTEALNAIVSGDVRTLVRGSLMVSLGILGLSLLARPFWPDLRLVSFQRAALWGIVIQAYLVSAPTIYTELETWRVDLAEQVAGAVSSGAIPGCSGDVVEVLLCITGTSPADILDPDLSTLPDQIPYGGSESVRDLYEHCAYNPPLLYGDPACDPDNPVGDPWEVLDYAQDALGSQLLALILALLILAYGVLHISLGLAAGMMFVIFPVAALFAFFLPLEGFAAGVIRNYISIFLKSIVLLTLAGIVIRLFSIATGSLTGMAAVALVDLLLCFVMAKEALSCLLGAISFVGSSVSSLGANVGLTGGGGGGGSPSQSPGALSHTASTMMTSSPTLQTLMGSPNSFHGGGSTVLGAAGSVLGSPARLGQAAVQAAVAAGSGGVGLLAGAAAAAKGADYGSLALTGSALTSTLGQDAGRGFVAGAGAMAMKQVLRGERGQGSRSGQGKRASRQDPGASEAEGPAFLAPSSQQTEESGPTPSILPGGGQLAGEPTPGGGPPSLDALDAALRGEGSIEGWTPDSTQQIETTAARLAAAPAQVQEELRGVAQAGHHLAAEWVAQGRSPIREDGSLDPQFTEAVVERDPEAATAFVQGQQSLPPEQRTSLPEAVALGLPVAQTLSGPEVRQGFAGAVKAMGREGDLDTSLRDRLGVGVQGVFGDQSVQAGQAAARMQEAGLSNDLGRQLVETVQEDLGRNRRLTPQRFREGGGYGRTARMGQWDRATGDPETTDRIVGGLIGLGPLSEATVYEIPSVGRAAQGSEAQASAVPAATVEAPEPPAPIVDMPAATVEGQDQAPPVTTNAPPAEPETPTQVSLAPSSDIGTTEQKPPAASSESPSPHPESSPGLYDQLCAWRGETATQSGQKAFKVFPNATLERIAQARPQTMEELHAVKGVGPKKLEQYGPAVLGITRPASGQVPAGPAVVERSAAGAPSPATEPAAAQSEPPVQATPEPGSEGHDAGLFEHLRTWRQMEAEQAGQRAFHVFSDATLKEIATAKPSTPGELREVKGVGPKKLDRYGQAVLGIVMRHPTREEGEEKP